MQVSAPSQAGEGAGCSADGSGAPSGSRNGNYKHGRYSAEMTAARRWLREATQMLGDLR